MQCPSPSNDPEFLEIHLFAQSEISATVLEATRHLRVC